MILLLVQLQEVFAHVTIPLGITSKKGMLLRQQQLQLLSLTHVLRLLTELANRSLEPNMIIVGGTKLLDSQDLI